MDEKRKLTMTYLASKLKGVDRKFILYYIFLASVSIALGLSSGIFANYFKEVYAVTAVQRGFIEIPRELPGVLAVFIVASLSFLGDIRLSIIAQLLSIFGIFVLGITKPPYEIMLLFIFINSCGFHLHQPLVDSIGLSLINDGNIGKRMGQFKGFTTGFTMIASLIVYLGFKGKFFSFESSIILPFLIAVLLFAIAIIALHYLYKTIEPSKKNKEKVKFKMIFRKEYKYYYILTIMFGVQKQILMVYGPWVLVDLLSQKADTLALLTMIGSFIGMFFIPLVGRCLDRFGIKKMLYADALSFIAVYLLYGLLCTGFTTGILPLTGLPVILAALIIVFDKMSAQMGMVRSIYLRLIAVDPSEVSTTLTLGQSFDHVISITCAVGAGYVWKTFGPEYVFYMAALLSFVNLYVAIRVKSNQNNAVKEKIS